MEGIESGPCNELVLLTGIEASYPDTQDSAVFDTRPPKAADLGFVCLPYPAAIPKKPANFCLKLLYLQPSLIYRVPL